jgi:hypothetical protein
MQRYLQEARMKHIRIIFYIALLGALIQQPLVAAQVTPVVSVQLYAGLEITGTVGTIYIVQYATNLSQPNNWQTLPTCCCPAARTWFPNCPASESITVKHHHPLLQPPCAGGFFSGVYTPYTDAINRPILQFDSK